MKKPYDDIFLKHCPTIDLHGCDRDYALILVEDFINENIFLKNRKVVIITGKGSGIVNKTTLNFLKNNRLVINYQINPFNLGMIIVDLE